MLPMWMNVLTQLTPKIRQVLSTVQPIECVFGPSVTHYSKTTLLLVTKHTHKLVGQHLSIGLGETSKFPHTNHKKPSVSSHTLAPTTICDLSHSVCGSPLTDLGHISSVTYVCHTLWFVCLSPLIKMLLFVTI